MNVIVSRLCPFLSSVVFILGPDSSAWQGKHSRLLILSRVPDFMSSAKSAEVLSIEAKPWMVAEWKALHDETMVNLIWDRSYLTSNSF